MQQRLFNNPKVHIAIMRKSWGLLPKILSGEKKLESRWYQNKYPPYNNIAKNDVVYFKNAGEPVTVKATVEKIIQHSDLTPALVKEILKKYSAADGLGIEKRVFDEFYQLFRNKKYCLIIFIKNPIVIEPFNIDKSGFGAMAAWITVDDIDSIKMPA
jgi:ASC-1-like (ASCH) protein